MLESLRDWLKRFKTPDTSPTAHSAVTGEVARQNRATLVAALREDVSRLQQEIVTISNAAEGRPGTAEQRADSAKISALEHQLTEKQQELAKLQGRI
jgi:hypothetical protein